MNVKREEGTVMAIHNLNFHENNSQESGDSLRRQVS